MHLNVFNVVLVLTYGTFGWCGTCFNASSVVEVDVLMEHYVFRKVRSPSLYSCASECLMSSVCMSFNFETRTRICELNSNSSDQVAVTAHPGFLFSDIDHWPKSLAGACSATSCGQKACHLDRLGRTACVREFRGCDEPPTLTNGTRKYDGVYLGAVTTYTCLPDFLMCRNSSSVCKASRKWSGCVGPCHRYRWDNPDGTRLTLPCKHVSRFKLSLYITPTAATSITVSVRAHADLLCHYEFRMDVNATVINTRVAGAWGAEIRLTHVQLALGVQSVTEITLEEGIYRLSVDGKGIYNFTGRFPDILPQNVKVDGAVLIESAEITL
ncbi:uncharacterized protein [Haliotis cracherodii]|uniref:uncharacterized protein n=1 Tax=Haliotis cracherodii TaxID=6455 RepID=UPI0039E743C8